MGRDGIKDYEQIKDCQIVDKYNLTDRKVAGVTVKGRQVRFNMNAVHLLGDCEYIQILVNREEKYMLALPCEKSDIFAIDWCKVNKKTGRMEPKDITSQFLSPKLYKLLNWDLDYSYKVQCFFQDFGDGRILLFFDLTEYVTLVQTEHTTADGKVRKRSKPYYMSNWADSFGPPLKKIEAKVNHDYSGYYIMGEEENQTLMTFERDRKDGIDHGAE